MVWFRVDDVLPFHERVIRAGNAAMGLWVRAGAWSAGQLTDGFVPLDVARTMGTRSEISRLVEVGLWQPADQGFQFHAWAEDGTGTKRQPTRAEVEAQRRAERERKAAWRESHRDGSRTPPHVPPGVPPGHPPDGPRDSGRTDGGRPDTPTRPDPTHIEKKEQRAPTVVESLLTDGVADATPPAERAAEVALIEHAQPPARRTGRSGYPDAFEEFWQAFPRHEGKRKAATAWEAACRRADRGAILDGARRYADDPNRDPAYTAHPTTWLNRDGWLDSPLPRRRPDSQQDRLRDSAAETLATLHRMGVA